jgi:hypothetical protein
MPIIISSVFEHPASRRQITKAVIRLAMSVFMVMDLMVVQLFEIFSRRISLHGKE